MSDLNPSNHEENPGPSSSVPCLSSVAIPSSTAGPIRRRRFSAAKIQPTRIKKVMQSDEEIGRMVASVPVAIGRAMEHFAEKFLQAAAHETQLSSSRTLTPVHMKLAMMANRHFHFLADIFKEATLPTLAAGPSSASPVCSPCTPVSPSVLSSVVNLGTTTSSPPVASSTLTVRKAVNGKKVDTAVDGEKPKRGRPRKTKRSEKCLDEELCEEVTNGIEKEDQDRALMPPPALPLGRARPVA
ncbi:unnamed protein product [Angiostrongylus costaricensis]|uniref:CBFD_NFYB_HMF domain-containing protein n=1 Tax=Angiostrongylus costaricensis TaxID=334426 RepID=A0A0R3PTM3_ANGCS|nr:unnamed protein product [Angiostrongylus costaricensis]